MPRAPAGDPAGAAPRAGATARPFAAAAAARGVAAPRPAGRRGTGPGAPSGGTKSAEVATSQLRKRFLCAALPKRSSRDCLLLTTQLGQPLITAGGNDKRAFSF